MATISMVSSKGGAGKTTSAVVVAGELARAGKTVGLVDSDPNFPLVRWANLAKPTSIKVYGDAEETSIQDTIEASQSRHDFTVVDLEGTANTRITYAVSLSNLTLIPLQGSALDGAEAAKSVGLLRRLEKVQGREVRFRAFFARVSGALRERTQVDIERQLVEGGVPLLDVALVDRAAFRALFSFGGTLETLDPSEVSGVGRARANAVAFTQAVLNAIKDGSS